MMPPIPNAQLEALAQRFVRFADQECGAYAPLYDRLARGIAGDPELLTIAAHTRCLARMAGRRGQRLRMAEPWLEHSRHGADKGPRHAHDD